MVDRNPWVLPGNGILSGLTLGAGASGPDDAAAQYDSPWDQAVREAWERQLASGPSPQLPITSNQAWPPFVGADWPVAPRLAWGEQSNHSVYPSNGGSTWLSAYQAPTPSVQALPTSSRAGTRGWGNPVGPGPLFDFGPWRKQATDGLTGLYDYLTSPRNTGAGTAEDSDSPDCQQQWSDARDQCIDKLTGPNPPRGVTGGYNQIEECARGLVSEACGGNYYERPPEPRVKRYRLR